MRDHRQLEGPPGSAHDDASPLRRLPGSDSTPPTFLQRTAVALGDQPQWLMGVEAAIAIVIVAAADYATGKDLSFSIFYLVPVLFLAWFVNRWAALTFAAVSAVLWVGTDTLAGAVYPSLLVPAWNTTVRLAFFVITVVLVERSRRAHDRERDLARTDSLTGVANGRRFDDRAQLALATMRRSGRPFTVAYVDLDHFKQVNDTSGHMAGDRLLRLVAKAIDGRLRDTDMVARLGGDEFSILLDGTDADEAEAAVGSIDTAIAKAIDGVHPVSQTIGAMTFTQAPESVDEMVRLADELMYEGKRSGRHRTIYGVWPTAENAAELSA